MSMLPCSKAFHAIGRSAERRTQSIKQHGRIILSTTLVMVLLAAFLFSTGAVSWAQTSANFDLSWHVIGNGGSGSNGGNGGEQSTSASYRVTGTIGQSIADPNPASGANFNVTSGFWVFTNATPEDVHLPFIVR